MIDAAIKLGAEGWEPIGITSADKTVGLNSNLLILKREIVAPAPPATSEEWQDDPTGRFDKRRWNGPKGVEPRVGRCGPRPSERDRRTSISVGTAA